MKAICRNKELIKTWKDEITKFISNRGISEFPTTYFEDDSDSGTIYENGYKTASCKGEYIFTDEGMIFEGRRNSLYSGSNCIYATDDYVELFLNDPIRIDVLKEEWEILETREKGRDVFDFGTIYSKREVEIIKLNESFEDKNIIFIDDKGDKYCISEDLPEDIEYEEVIGNGYLYLGIDKSKIASHDDRVVAIHDHEIKIHI